MIESATTTIAEPTTPASEPIAASEPPTLIATFGLNITVQNCCKAYNKAYLAECAKGAKDFDAREKALVAYRNLMPHLTSQANIRGFIACIGHGMLIEIIRKDDGAKLLYAAQTALAALPRELKSAGRPQSNRVYQKINIPPPFPPYVND
jgi:hypothetical protein